MLRFIKFRFSVKLNHNHSVKNPFTVGGLRNYLYKYVLVKQLGGTLTIVLEDRREKSTEDSGQPDILKCLDWLRVGPKDDAEAVKVVSQSARAGQYQAIVNELGAKKLLYHCFCTQTTNCNCRDLTPKELVQKVARKEKMVRVLMRMDSNLKKMSDDVYGDLSPPAQTLPDLEVITKGKPALIFSRISDCLLTEVTHYIQEHRNIDRIWYIQKIYQALGLETPSIIHLPNITYGKNSTKSVSTLKEKYYTPKAVLNAAALLGWAPFGSGFLTQMEENDDNFSLEQIVKYFKTDTITKENVTFTLNKLDRFNRKDITSLLTDQQLQRHFPNHGKSKQYMKQVYEIARKSKISSLDQLSELQFLVRVPDYSKPRSEKAHRKIYGKQKQHTEANKKIITSLIEIFQQHSFNLSPKSILTAISTNLTNEYDTALNLLKYCVSGTLQSKAKYSITEACCLLGAEQVVARLKKCI